MTYCKVLNCQQLVMPLTDKGTPSVRHKFKNGPNSTGVTWAHPSVPDPSQLCYYHKKVAQGLIEARSSEVQKDAYLYKLWTLSRKEEEEL